MRSPRIGVEGLEEVIDPGNMKTYLDILRRFIEDQAAQDLIEYELLVAFVVVISAAIFQLSHVNISSIWTTTDGNLDRGIQAAS